MNKVRPGPRHCGHRVGSGRPWFRPVRLLSHANYAKHIRTPNILSIICEAPMRMSAAVSALVSFLASLPSPAQDEARLLRFPTIHGDAIVFSHAGNLYSVAASGGLARRLTSHDGSE